MLGRLMLRLEVIGYSRAIGVMAGQHGVTAAHMKSLYEAREKAVLDLKKSKDQAIEERYTTAFMVK